MRSRFFPLIVLVLLSGLGVYAYVANDFPNTLPRIPDSPGTFGSVLKTILSVSSLSGAIDGTVRNTSLLDGVDRNGYLKPSSSCSPGKVWGGTAADGSRICINKPGMLAMDIGELTESCPGTTIYHADGTSSSSPAVPFSLKNGDILDTPASGCATIAFEDFSVLRLGEETTLSLDVGTIMPSEELVANILMDNGQVWGRILTETGSYNIGDGTVTAAVRGTSISLEKTGATIAFTNPTGDEWMRTKSGVQRPLSLNVVDSTIASDSVEISCAGAPGGLLQKIKLNPLMNVSSTAGACPTTGTLKSRSDILSENSWIRENTKKDIVYLADRAKRLDVSEPKQERIRDELRSSNVSSMIECMKLLSGIAVPANGDNSAVSLSPNNCGEIVSESNLEKKYFRTACALRKKVYWNTLSDGERLSEICQDEGFIAFVDFTEGVDLILSGKTLEPRIDKKRVSNTLLDDGLMYRANVPMPLYKNTNLDGIIDPSSDISAVKALIASGYDGLFISNTGSYQTTELNGWNKTTYLGGIWDIGTKLNISPSTNTNGIFITGTNYIAYPLSQLPDLRGKKITIELESTLPPSSDPEKYYILHLGNNNSFYSQGGTIKCGFGSGNICAAGDVVVSGSKYTLKIPSITLTQLVIGNYYKFGEPRHLELPINRRIKSIRIFQ